jgi:HEAT repeat protein
VGPIDRLRTCHETLPPDVRGEVLALGSAAIPALIEILCDEDLANEDAPGNGWPPIHAAKLLGDLKAREAIEPMLRVLAETEFDHVINGVLSRRLPEFGADVLEPALLLLEQASGDDGPLALVSVLAQIGVRDDRIFDAICNVFDDDVIFGAMDFADYGDPRALPLLEEAIADFVPDFSHPIWRHDLNELLDAHETLGGVLDEDLRARVDAIDQLWEQHKAGSGRTSTRKVGRNEPCPCGSGKKHKKCCLGKAPDEPAPEQGGLAFQRPGPRG